MKLLYVAVLLTLVRASITTQDMVTIEQSEDMIHNRVKRQVPHMIGGHPMKVKSAVMILIKRVIQGGTMHQYECAGTIIDQQFILTAAHCTMVQKGGSRGH